MNHTINKVDKLVYGLVTENTGQHFLDSGGAYGRNWQRNAKKSIEDFKNADAVTVDRDWLEKYKELDVTYSVFKYLTAYIQLDDLCERYNRLKCPDWDGFTYGVSAKQTEWLENHGFEVSEDAGQYAPKEFNTYNGPDWFGVLSQILQGTFIYNRDNQEWYCLLQVHGGCDARGGYTDAKLVQIVDGSTWDGPMDFLPSPDYTLSINGKIYDFRGPDVTSEEGTLEDLPKITAKTKVEAWAMYE